MHCIAMGKEGVVWGEEGKRRGWGGAGGVGLGGWVVWGGEKPTKGSLNRTQRGGGGL